MAQQARLETMALREFKVPLVTPALRGEQENLDFQEPREVLETLE